MFLLLFSFQFIVLTSLLIYCSLKWFKILSFPSKFPPGPPSVPLLGVLPFIKGDFKSALQGWREDYGEIVGVKLGSELAVVLSEFELISDVFKDSRFTGRPKSLQTVMSALFSSSPNEKNGGIVFTHGNQWQEQRRFALKTLRDFGFGKSCMEDVIQSELKQLNQVLTDSSTSSTSLAQSLSVSVVNSIWTILTGQRIPHGDETVRAIVEGTDDFIKNESLSGPIMMLPWLRHVPGIREKFQASKAAPLRMRQMQDKTVAEHEEEEEDSNDKKDFIGVYLDKIKSTEDAESSFYGESGRLNLQRSLTDLFGAGTETSSSMLLFAFLYMIKHPEIQEKIQKEIEEVLGEGGEVTLNRRADLPYTDACLHEVMRHTCLVYTVPHATSCDVVLQDYDLPRDTAVYANVWSVMHSEDYWRDPTAFRPERFLDEGGRFKRDDRCIPFMVGKRACIGQSLAQMQLFLFFAGILQKFRFEAPQGCEKVCTDPVVGFLHSCPNYEVLIRKRRG